MLADLTPTDAPEVILSDREKDDNYSRVVAHLNDEWRVIVCRDDWQWILQSRRGTEWRGRSYHTTKETVLRNVRRLCGASSTYAMRVLEALPDRFRPEAVQ